MPITDDILSLESRSTRRNVPSCTAWLCEGRWSPNDPPSTAHPLTEGGLDAKIGVLVAVVGEAPCQYPKLYTATLSTKS